MKWSAADVSDIIAKTTLLVGAIAACISAWRGFANGNKLSEAQAKADSAHAKIASIETKIDAVHSSLQAQTVAATDTQAEETP